MSPTLRGLRAARPTGRRRPRKNPLRCCAVALGMALLPGAMAGDEVPAAVASIKPLHSLLAGVMAGVAEPHVLILGGASPHTYSLKPSDAALLERAALVVWVGANLETFLARPIATLADDAHVLELSRAPSISMLRNRQGGLWEDAGHHGATDDREHKDGHYCEHHEGKHHGEEHHEGEHHGKGHHAGEHHAEGCHCPAKKHHGEHHDEGHHEEADGHRHHGKHHDEGHHEEADGHGHHGDGHHEDEAADAPHANGRAHGHGIHDMHVWLNPENAAVIAQLMAAALAELDPAHADRYRSNAEQLKARLQALDAELRDTLAPVADRGFIVFHDAWQYFDTHYGLRALGSITVSPEQAPGAARLVAIRERLVTADAACVFSEPQFQPRIVQSLVADTGVATGELDPLGAALEAGPELYFQLMRGIAQALQDCLQP